MKRKKVILFSGLVLTGSLVSAGIIAGVSVYNNSRQRVDSTLNEDVKKVIVDYNLKSQIEANKVEEDKLIFSTLTNQDVKIIVKGLTVSRIDSSILNVVVMLKNEKENKISEDRIIEIKGFKKNPMLISKHELNSAIKDINTVVYEGNSRQILAKDVDKNKIHFSSYGNEYDVIIKDLGVNISMPTVLEITFVLRAKGGGLIESESKKLSLDGFLKPMPHMIPKNKEQLDEIASKITRINYLGDKSITAISNIDIQKIQLINLPSEYIFDVVSLMPKPQNPTTAILTFTIREMNANLNLGIKSSEKILEIENFRKPFLTMEQLNKELIKITTLDYDAKMKLETEVKNINKLLIKFPQLDKNLNVNIETVQYKQNSNSTASVTFSLKEKDGKAYSNRKTLDINGFKETNELVK